MKQKQLQYAAITAIVVCGILFLYNLVSYIQTIYTLRSPLISTESIKMIADLPLRLSLLSAIVLLLSFILYRFKKYILIVLLAVLFIVVEFYFPDLLM